MEFGIFDQNDAGIYPLSEQYESRLKLLEIYDRAGFRAYHMSEHHSTPLSLTPSPSVFLAAASQRTQNLRIGALVYVLPTHHPLRLAEEICMLDHLTKGRVDIGIGRGASPHELEHFGVDPAIAPAMYVEAYNVIKQAMTQDEVSFAGTHYSFADVPFPIKPRQLPHPPFFYAVPTPEGAVWPAQSAINIVAGGSVANVRAISDRFRLEWASAGRDPANVPLIGINRFVVAAETDQKALELGRRAWPDFYNRFMTLWKRHGTAPRYARLPEDFDTVVANQAAIVGSPATIRAAVDAMIDEAGVSYFIAQFSFGDLAHEEVLQSVQIFAEQVVSARKQPSISTV
jgi:alkanesulfonate monooxygenase SsuD/methylene tetrahydromethanopterin reductase-like flavin-dependent oxidoreductase (luciferase family)